MFNKVTLIGRLGKDPEVRYTTEGHAVTNVSLATTESWKDKSGAKQEKTEWHNLVFYRGLAETAAEYLKKGAMIFVEGKLTTEKYQKNGEERYATKIVISELKMLGSNNKAEAEHEAEYSATPAAKPVKGRANTDGDEPF
ncbi:MAG: single-stranded DNA-binding protein [Gallionella sp.]